MNEVPVDAVESEDVLSYDAWLAILEDADSPVLDEGDQPYLAAQNHPAMALAMMQRVSQYGTAFREAKMNYNPFLLLNTGSFGGLRTFGSWTESIRFFVDNYDQILGNLPPEARWDITSTALEFLDADAQGRYTRAVADYLDEKGQPLPQTLERWCGLPSLDGQTAERVFTLWLSWSTRAGVYPTFVNASSMPTGTEFVFSNGLRIYDNTQKAQILGTG